MYIHIIHMGSGLMPQMSELQRTNLHFKPSGKHIFAVSNQNTKAKSSAPQVFGSCEATPAGDERDPDAHPIHQTLGCQGPLTVHLF